MQENKKNPVEEALIQMKNVEEAIAENAKGILASTMKEEINQLVKESLSEQDEVDVDAEMDVDDTDDVDVDDVDMDVDDTDMGADNVDDVDIDIDTDIEDAPIDLTDASDEEILKVFKAMGEEDGIIVKKDGDNVHLSDNDADVEYLVKLGESEEEKNLDEMEMDEIQDVDTQDVIDAIFSKDGEVSDLDIDQDEVMYEIEFDEEADDELDEESDEELDEEADDELDEESDDELDETLDESYNHKKAIKPKGVGIGHGPKFAYKKGNFKGFSEDKKEGPKTMGTGKAKFEYKKGANLAGKAKKVETKESEIEKDDTLKKKVVKKGETKEASRTLGAGKKWGREGLDKPRTSPRDIQLESEVTMLREKNEEYRKALNVFREKLNEVAIFNSNLAYATRLFTEHSTTKKEKINILRRHSIFTIN